MSDKEAKVRLNLDAAGYMAAIAQAKKATSGLEDALADVGDAAETSSRKTSRLSSSLAKGLGAGKESLKALGSEMKHALTMAASLGGALGLGSAAVQAVDLASKYRDIAFAIQAGTGKATSWLAVQSSVQAASAKWAVSNNEAADSLRAIYDDVGDLDYAKVGMEEVAKATRATGAPAEALRGLVGQLNEKFGITAEQLPDTMAAMVALGNKGGISLADLGEKLGMVGASAKLAGIDGKDGLERVVAMLNIADGTTGNLKKSIAAVTQTLDQLGDPAKAAQIKKELGVDLKMKDGTIRKDAIEAILAKTGGKKELLAKVFSADSLKLVSGFGDTYAKAFSAAKGTTEQKTAEALRAYHDALAAAGKQTLSAKQLEAQATARMGDPRARFQAAINTFTDALQKPEVVGAIEKVAAVMPKLAEVLGNVVGWAADNPLLAGAAYVGARSGGAGLMEAGGDLAGGYLRGAAKGIGQDIATEFAARAAVNGKWAAAGSTIASVAGPLLGAAVAFELGKMAIDAGANERDRNTSDLAAGSAGAESLVTSFERAKTPGAKAALLAQMREKRKSLAGTIASAEENKGGVGGFFANTFSDVATFLGAPGDTRENAQASSEASLRKLDEAIAKVANGLGQLDKASQGAARSVGAAGTAVGNGLPPKASTGSGSGT